LRSLRGRALSWEKDNGEASDRGTGAGVARVFEEGCAAEWFGVACAAVAGVGVSASDRAAGVGSRRFAHVRLDSGGGWVLVRRGKGGRSRAVRFGRRLAGSLLRYRRIVGEGGYLFPGRGGGHISSRTLQLWLKRALAEADLPRDFTFHALRHTYATVLYARSNHNLRLVQQQLGHVDLRSTQLYTSINPTAYTSILDSLY